MHKVDIADWVTRWVFFNDYVACHSLVNSAILKQNTILQFTGGIDVRFLVKRRLHCRFRCTRLILLIR